MLHIVQQQLVLFVLAVASLILSLQRITASVAAKTASAAITASFQIYLYSFKNINIVMSITMANTHDRNIFK